MLYVMHSLSHRIHSLLLAVVAGALAAFVVALVLVPTTHAPQPRGVTTPAHYASNSGAHTVPAQGMAQGRAAGRDTGQAGAGVQAAGVQCRSEDTPGWDARRCGNRLAGPGDEHGPRLIDGLLACSPGGRVEVHAGAVTCDYAPSSAPARCSSDADCALFDRLVRGVVSDGRP